ncbi:hypothetical protein K402DRAFT_123316 [Aulographum hederae CBS 113979]|uniref:Uncharacterized protein n=1 Tax=Aulographum hederae CBS 113979 TaxID=1176131 RepID=A0A6G1HEH6_9PEZI|nr:hypothetical protein K402DRAFT_123316 [Aulographum hederae CBS 113979]
MRLVLTFEACFLEGLVWRGGGRCVAGARWRSGVEWRGGGWVTKGDLGWERSGELFLRSDIFAPHRNCNFIFTQPAALLPTPLTILRPFLCPIVLVLLLDTPLKRTLE